MENNNQQMGSIYKISNDINSHVYIGQTVQPIKNRFLQHIYSAKKGSTCSLHLAISKYGQEHFFIELIEECNVENLDNREKYWINYYDSYNNGYNMTLGGSSIYTADSKRIKIDDLYIYKLWDEGKSSGEIEEITGYSKSTIRTHLMKYKNYSIEESEQRGYKKSARTKEKKIYQWDQNGNFIAEYQSARDADQKTGISYKNLSLALNGKNKTAGGFLWTFTNKKPIIEKKKRIVQYDIEDNLIAIYDTQTEAGKMTAIDPSGIGKVIHGKRKTCGGYKWKEEFL